MHYGHIHILILSVFISKHIKDMKMHPAYQFILNQQPILQKENQEERLPMFIRKLMLIWNRHCNCLIPDVAAPRTHPSHIDYYVANGIKANIALEKNDWATAESAADIAMSGGTSMLTMSDLEKGFAFNDANAKTVLWGAKIIAEQTDGTQSFFGHMDASTEFYAETSRKCISSWLYNQMSDTDVRKNTGG